MINNPKIIIRKYHSSDRESIREISYNTAYLGNSASLFFNDREIFADILTLYFTDYEPESCFIAEDKGKVIGYLTGTKNTKNMKKCFIRKILFPLLFKAIKRNSLLKKQNKKLINNLIKSTIKKEFHFPDFSEQYPATFHTNIIKEYRGQNIGTKLMERFFSYLESEKITGIHCATISERASKFYLKHGFNLLFKTKLSYLKYRTGKVFPYYVLGKKL
ncbi:GNAT family N-acetyltransferase [Chlamydiota bacterium]